MSLSIFGVAITAATAWAAAASRVGLDCEITTAAGECKQMSKGFSLQTSARKHLKGTDAPRAHWSLKKADQGISPGYQSVGFP